MRISQRNKKSNKSTLTVTERFPFPFESIPLKISGMPDAWFRLYALSAKPEELGKFIYVHFVAPALRHLVVKRPRGPHKSKAQFINRIKNISAYDYCLFEHWLKRPEEEWPRTIRKVIRDFEEREASYSHSGQTLKPKAHEITAYIMEKKFGRKRKAHKIQNPWTDDPQSFKKIYISKELRKYYRVCLSLLAIQYDPMPDLPISAEDPMEVISQYLNAALETPKHKPVLTDQVTHYESIFSFNRRPRLHQNLGCKIAIPQIWTLCKESSLVI